MDSVLSKFASSSITKENAISISLGSFHHRKLKLKMIFSMADRQPQLLRKFSQGNSTIPQYGTEELKILNS
jgi:hypothetical protein